MWEGLCKNMKSMFTIHQAGPRTIGGTPQFLDAEDWGFCGKEYLCLVLDLEVERLRVPCPVDSKVAFKTD